MSQPANPVTSAASIALWRPHCSRITKDIHADEERAWSRHANQKIQTAAKNTNNVLERIISDQLVNYIGPMTCVMQLLSPSPPPPTVINFF